MNAWTTFEGKKIAVKRATLPRGGYCGTPGRIVQHTQEGVAVACGENGARDALGIILLEVQPDGEDPRPAAEVFTRTGGRVT